MLRWRMSTDQLRSDLVGVQIYFSTMQSVTLQTDPAYTFLALLSDIGGALGLMLGATILTLVEVAQFSLHLLVDVLKINRERGKEKAQRKSVTTINAVGPIEVLRSRSVNRERSDEE
jgi:Amiloride-sensitive sodium channel